ncbi:MAG TPA: hypothetical protein VGL17_04020, partial [Gemmatimonadaceae bacterium]
MTISGPTPSPGRTAIRYIQCAPSSVIQTDNTRLRSHKCIRDARSVKEAMRFSTCVYPWDLARIGVREALAELADLGVSALKMYPNYHSIETISPRGSLAGYCLPLGGVLFPTDRSSYGRIQPEVVADDEVLGVWWDLAEQAPRAGIDIEAWIVGLYQPWMALKYPDCARVLPTGDVLTAGVCPASADVADYVVTLVEDVCRNFGVGNVALERISFPAFDDGWSRPRVLFPLTLAGRWLLGLCFCRNCVARSIDLGVDVAALRHRVLTRITCEVKKAGAADDASAMNASLMTWLDEDPELAAFVRERSVVVGELAERVAETLHAGSTARSLFLLPGTAVETRSSVDRLLEVLVEHTDGMICMPGRYAGEPEIRRIADARGSHLELLSMVFPTSMVPPMGSVADQLRTAAELRP